jgi:hypothetical protein
MLKCVVRRPHIFIPYVLYIHSLLLALFLSFVLYFLAFLSYSTYLNSRNIEAPKVIMFSDTNLPETVTHTHIHASFRIFSDRATYHT